MENKYTLLINDENTSLIDNDKIKISKMKKFLLRTRNMVLIFADIFGCIKYEDIDFKLWCAVLYGDTECIKECLRKGANLKNSALMNATSGKYFEACKLLIINGCSLCDGEQVLFSCAYNGRLDVIKYLIERGVNPNIMGEAPLRTSIEKGYYDIAIYLIENGASYKCDGTKCIDLLDKNGASFDKYGNALLEHYSEKGDLKSVKLLIEKGVIMDNNSCALQKSVKNGHIHIVELLIQNGALINDLALFTAIENGNTDIVKCLINNGAHLDDYSLHTAIKSEYYDIIAFLLPYYQLKELKIILTNTEIRDKLLKFLLKRNIESSILTEIYKCYGINVTELVK